MSEHRRTIAALQGFRIDEIRESSGGSLVALTLHIPSRKDASKMENIEVALAAERALELGQMLVSLAERMTTRMQ